MEKGQIIRGQVNNINEKGYYINLPSGGFGHMPHSLKKSSRLINRWDFVYVVVYKVFENESIQLCDEEYWNYEQSLKSFRESAEPGNTYDAEIIEVTKDQVKVKICENLEGVITRENISWNKVELPEDIVYVGEPVKVSYLFYKNSVLHFALRLLDAKPYAEELYELSLTELLERIGHSGTSFIGKATKHTKYWSLENVCSANPGEEGHLLTDPEYGYNLNAVASITHQLEEGKYYRFAVSLVEKEIRLKRNQLYQFQARDFQEVGNPYSYDTLQIFKKNISPRTNVTAAHLLEEVGQNMYSSKDRMFYELIQNADDAASRKGVIVKVNTAGDYLTLSHNGFSFDRDDFEAITSAANGTKKANENKTGYKGIGFKSVFTDSERVFIKTGGYQFKFDRTQPQFQDFERFYFFVNELSTQEQKDAFLKRFDSERKSFKGVKDIPWQMEPIWVRDFPAEIAAFSNNPNVFIALKIGSDKINEPKKGYHDTISEIMANPRFMLFLRKTRRIDFNEKTVSRDVEGSIITIKNSFSKTRVEVFKRKDNSVPVNDEAFKALGIDIRRRIQEQDDERIVDATFINGKGQEYENIPKKIAIADSTEISFAVPYDSERERIIPDTKCSGISMFAYLPTLVKDFRFPFFINANFVLDSSRERIKGDNPWNHFLMSKIASSLVSWVAELGKNGDPNSLNLLVQSYFDESSNDTELLARYFNQAYRRAIEESEFIVDMDGELSSQDDIILDDTGLAQIVGTDVFCEIMGTSRKLPSSEIDSTILKKRIFEEIRSVGHKELAVRIVSNPGLASWINAASESDLARFFTWLKDNQDKYPGLAESLPVFTFGKERFSANNVRANNELIITTEKIRPIKEILEKLGLKCSAEQIEQSPLNGCIKLRSEKSIFETISSRVSTDVITPEEKVILLEALNDFDEVGFASITALSPFKNVEGTYIPLKSLAAYREDAPEWIKPYMIGKDDYSSTLDRYLVDREREFAEIIWNNLSSISTSIDDLYAYYKWTETKYTTQLIDNYARSSRLADILGVVELSDIATKQYYLKKVELRLKSGNHYDKNSVACRILRLARTALEKPVSYASHIFFDDCCIQTLSIKDTITVPFSNNSSVLKTTLPITRILPNSDMGAGAISALKATFSVSSEIESFIEAKEVDLRTVFDQLNTELNIPERNFSVWPTGIGNAIQYIYSVYGRKYLKGWNNAFVPKIDLGKESPEFVTELMDFLFNNNISTSNSSFTHAFNYINGVFFDNDYTYEENCLLPSIEAWADNEKKQVYLIKNGARQASDPSVLLRKALEEDLPFDQWSHISDADAVSSLKFYVETNTESLPIIGENRKQLVDVIIKKPLCRASRRIDIEKLQNFSKELSTPEYTKWRESHYPAIFLYPESMPYKISMMIGNTDYNLYNYSEGDYFTTKDRRVLYVNGDIDLDSLLFQIARDNKTDFNLDDYKLLCMDGRTLISNEKLEGMTSELDFLTAEVMRKDELIREYERRLGIGQPHSIISSTTNTPSLKKGDPEPLSKDEQKEAQIEAQRFLMEIEPTWVFPEDFGKYDEDGEPCCYSTETASTPDGDIAFVLKSHIQQDAPLRVNTIEWEFLTTHQALLLIYDGNDIKNIDVTDLIRNQSSITLSFSTTNLDVEERIDAFAKSLRYFKDIHFDLDSFHLSKRVESIRYLTNIHDGFQAEYINNDDNI